ncbi:MAG: hypothetical protein Q8P18_29420 [Pseudomonadota bacterium]|nr:hypothetical protein [Pseudomonadota bacterium]
MLLSLALVACTPQVEQPDSAEDTDTDVPPVEDTDEPDDTDLDDTGTAPANRAPTAPQIVLSPPAPDAGEDFAVVIVKPSIDLDGDPVTYSYGWTLDGVPVDLTGVEVSGATTVQDQVWEVTVTPTDGTDAGPPSVASAVLGNAAPTPPGLSFSPAAVGPGDAITLVLDPAATDPEGDPLTISIRWYDDGFLVPTLNDLLVVPGSQVELGETFRAVASVTDGYHTAVSAEASLLVEIQCDDVPAFNGGDTTLSDARAYHGIAFESSDETLIGFDGSSLIKSTYGGSRSVFLPGLSGIQQMDRLPDGDLVLGDSTNARLLRVTPSGGSATISSAVGSVYGVTVGPDGNVYVANGVAVLRVDPTSGELTTLVTVSGWSAHSLNFNLDSTIMYIGSIGTGGIVYYVTLDADLNPTSEPLVYASGVGIGYHDGIEVDACGNLYVADYSSRGFYRVELDGTVTSFSDPVAELYGHGAVWGNGVGGWRDDAIYQPQPYNGNSVREIVVGFGSGDKVRTWNGVAAPW